MYEKKNILFSKSDRQNVKSDLDRAANLVYDMYYNNILDTIEKIQPKYAPNNAANDPYGLNEFWIIGVRAFYNDIGYSGVIHVKMEEGLERIEDEAFKGIKIDKIPDSVRYIGKNAFGEIENVKNILPSNLETLQECSFQCYGGKVVIPASVKYIAINAIEWLDCYNDIHGYNVTKDNPYYKSDENGWLYSKDGKTLYFAYRVNTGSLVIPKGVKYVYKEGIDLGNEDTPEGEDVKILADKDVEFR